MKVIKQKFRDKENQASIVEICLAYIEYISFGFILKVKISLAAFDASFPARKHRQILSIQARQIVSLLFVIPQEDGRM